MTDIKQLIEQLNAIAVGKTVPVNVFTATLRKSADAMLKARKGGV